jgi:hypothetical protein
MTNLNKFQGVATTVRRLDSGMIVGQYHNTSVAEVLGSNVRLNTGGYRTNTTKVRMNQFANQFCNGAFSVYQKDFEWYAVVKTTNKTYKFDGNTLEFDV